MSYSSSEAGASADVLTPRLGAALAASAALHLALAGALGSIPGGPPAGAMAADGRNAFVLRTRLRAAPDSDSLGLAAASTTSAELPRADSSTPATSGASGGTPEANPLLPPRYYSARELDVRPGILTRVEPEYPLEAARRFLSGTVVAKLLIDESGAVQQVAIVSADPPGYFEAAAQKAFAAARFTPGMKNGRAVRVQVVLEILFEVPPPPRPPA